MRRRRLARVLSAAQATLKADLSSACSVVSAAEGQLLTFAASHRPCTCCSRPCPERAFYGEGEGGLRQPFTPADFMEKHLQGIRFDRYNSCARALSSIIVSWRIVLSDDGNGLFDYWPYLTAYVDPPFSAFLGWLRRPHEQWCIGNVKAVICFGPVCTDSAMFHKTLIAHLKQHLWIPR